MPVPVAMPIRNGLSTHRDPRMAFVFRARPGASFLGYQAQACDTMHPLAHPPLSAFELDLAANDELAVLEDEDELAALKASMMM